MERLPIPMKVKDVLYTGFDFDAPSPNLLADTQDMAKDVGLFQAMRKFCAGTITAFYTGEDQKIDDPISIKSLVPKMYHKSAEVAAMKSVLKNSDTDGIEGIYSCPMCGTTQRAELMESDGITIDTRDFLSKLDIRYFDIEKDQFIIERELSEPYCIRNRITGDVIDGWEVESIGVEIPTLEHCITAESKVQSKNYLKIQIAIYAESLKKVNGREITSNEKHTFAPILFGDMRTSTMDLGYISKQINKYGIDKTKEKTCKACGKVWRAILNTSNFSDGALPLF